MNINDVQLISRIATIMNKDGLHAKLAGAKSAKEMYDLLCREEKRYEQCNCTLTVRGFPETAATFAGG